MHIIQKAELNIVSAHLLKCAFLIKVHCCSNGGTLPTAELPHVFEEILKKFLGLFGSPTYAKLLKERRLNCEIIMDPYGNILFHSPYSIPGEEEKELWRRIEKVICCGRIQPYQSSFGSPVLFMLKTYHMLRMCIDYGAVYAIMVKDLYTLPHIKCLLNSMHGSCWFTKLDLVAGYHQICITIADRHKMAFTTKIALYKWQLLQFGLANALSQFIHMLNGTLVPMKCKFIIIYLHDIMIHSCALAEHVICV